MKTNVVLYVCVLLFFSQNISAGEVMTERKLAKCPDTPNCVCSLDNREGHSIAPIAIGGVDPGLSQEIMLKVINQLSRSKIVVNEPGFLQATFTSLIFRFVDDVEFLWEQHQGVIQIRSASRVGHSDLGVNRRRMEEIRQLYKNKLQELLRSGA